ncbi:MAG TPA: hypothetical protein VLE43_19820 [Candidatus Saccharimonadia bacterium]|nr:hypothetical protein [Candidatus Saccharimonadia bacterium]
MNSQPLNIYERIIQRTLHDCRLTATPRIFVKRQSIEVIGPNFEREYQTVFESNSALLQDFAAGDFKVSDIASFFTLTTRWDQSEPRSEIELDQTRYSELPLDSKARLLFSFSTVVPAADGFAFYGFVNRGFLAAHSYLCHFMGTFEEPVSHALTVLRQS